MKVRIEYDDIQDAPRVWIDGEQLDKPLVKVDYSYHADTCNPGHKHLTVQWRDKSHAAAEPIVRSCIESSDNA